MVYFLIFSLSVLIVACTEPLPPVESENEFPQINRRQQYERRGASIEHERQRASIEHEQQRASLERLQEQTRFFGESQEQRQNECLTLSMVIRDKKADEPVSYQNLDISAYYASLCRSSVVILKCRCAYFNGKPTEWIAIKGTVQKPETEEEIETMLLEVCQSHNPSFKIYPCSN